MTLEQRVERLEKVIEYLASFGHKGECFPCKVAMCVQGARLRHQITKIERNLRESR